ncbi:MAG TPA: FHA domain-containing protein, partial [Egibacteraceae bacterium]|nr:FHA domain-containing protein [Egibacteraceae bacterium]
RGKVEAGPEPPPAPPDAEPPVRITDERRPEPAAEPAAPAIAEGTTAYLHVLTGGPRGQRYRLDPPAIVGRLPQCDVTLDDPSVSRRHARITHQDGSWSVEDLGSTNGLRINGATVGRARLRNGDRLELGTVKLAFSLEG